jgi:DnaK suppressor protein
VRVAARAERGRANDALIELVAASLAVPRRRVHLVAGATTRDKVVEVERRRVMDAIANLQEENAGSMVEETPETGLADTATVTLDRELDYSLEEHSTAVLRDIDAALQRIEDGTYGVCARCGKPIGEERLEAMPYVTKCIDCKRLEERA